MYRCVTIAGFRDRVAESEQRRKLNYFRWGRSFGSAPKTKMYTVLLYLKYEVVQMFALITLKFTALNETFKAHDD